MRIRLMKKRILAGALLGTFLGCVSCAHGSNAAPEAKCEDDCSAYFPLVEGNFWEYSYREYEKGRQIRRGVIRWEVRQSAPAELHFPNEQGTAFVLWPTPLPSDDAQQWLTPTKGAIRSLQGAMDLLHCPFSVGQQWSHESDSVTLGRKVQHNFKIVSVAPLCKVGSFQFTKCVTVEDYDEELDLRTLVTYAKDVGPVSHRYFRAESAESKGELLREGELLKYQVKPTKK